MIHLAEVGLFISVPFRFIYSKIPLLTILLPEHNHSNLNKKPWKISTRGEGAGETYFELINLYCKLLIVVYFLLVSYLTEWMLCLNKIK